MRATATFVWLPNILCYMASNCNCKFCGYDILAIYMHDIWQGKTVACAILHHA